jgi:hypothetical protein
VQPKAELLGGQNIDLGPTVARPYNTLTSRRFRMPTLPIAPAPFNTPATREFVNAIYADDEPKVQGFVWSKLSRNTTMPRLPGQPGLIIAATLMQPTFQSGMGRGAWFISRGASKRGEPGNYMGEYVVVNYAQMTAECFRDQGSFVRLRFAVYG